jgi:prephenate dehydrogenase
MTGAFAIGIVGGRGAMGDWFVRFFRDRGYPVHISERDRDLPLEELTRLCKVVIVSVPIDITPSVINQVGPLLARDALLMDLTSLKSAPMRAMLAATRAEVIGLHPLFGPDVRDMTGQNIVLCPGRGATWLPWTREALASGGAVVVETSPERHDAMMAVIQGLNHLNTMTLGLILREAGLDPAELERFSTPAFRNKTTMIEKVFTQNPRLYADIVVGNPALAPLLDLYESVLARLARAVRSGNPESLAAILKDRP